MAYVAITKERTTNIQNRIDELRCKEIKAMCPDFDKEFTLDASELFNRGAWGAAHVHLIKSLPVDWLNKTNRAHVTIKGEHSINGAAPAKAHAGITFNGLTAAYYRPSPGYGTHNCVMTIDELRALPDEMVGRAEAIQRYEDECTAMEINSRWAGIQKPMMEFLAKCKSLNEAIKLFPNIKLYLDPRDINKVEKKVERSAREKVVVDVAVAEGLTAAAIASKLMEAA